MRVAYVGPVMQPAHAPRSQTLHCMLYGMLGRCTDESWEQLTECLKSGVCPQQGL